MKTFWLGPGGTSQIFYRLVWIYILWKTWQPCEFRPEARARSFLYFFLFAGARKASVTMMLVGRSVAARAVGCGRCSAHTETASLGSSRSVEKRNKNRIGPAGRPAGQGDEWKASNSRMPTKLLTEWRQTRGKKFLESREILTTPRVAEEGEGENWCGHTV